MASLVTYFGTASGLSTNQGKTVKDINLEYTRATTTLPANLDTTCDVYEAASSVDNRRDLTCMAAVHYRQAQLQTLEGIRRLGGVCDKRLLDRPTVLTPLSLSDLDVWKTQQAIIEDLFGNHTVKGNVFAIGTVTAGSGNVGNGSIVPDITLDAVSAPCQRLRAHRRYNGVASEMLCVETMKVVCVADSSGQILPGWEGNRSGRLIEPNYVVGNELFYICGKVPAADRVSFQDGYGVGYGLTADGSGPGPVFYPVDCDLSTPESTLISNRGFEDWNAGTNIPDDWEDLSTGATTTNVLKSTGTKFLGSSSLQFLGSGTATINRGQTIDTSRLIAGKKYYLSLWINVEAGAAAGTVLVQFTGTGYTASSSEKVTFAASSADGDGWVHYGFHIRMPLVLPSDWLLKLEVNSTLTSAKSVFFDHVNLKEEPWHGGLSCSAYNGSTAPAIGDYWTFPITQSATGVAQEFHKRWWGVQWPSNLAAGEDIADSLYT